MPHSSQFEFEFFDSFVELDLHSSPFRLEAYLEAHPFEQCITDFKSEGKRLVHVFTDLPCRPFKRSHLCRVGKVHKRKARKMMDHLQFCLAKQAELAPDARCIALYNALIVELKKVVSCIKIYLPRHPSVKRKLAKRVAGLVVSPSPVVPEPVLPVVVESLHPGPGAVGWLTKKQAMDYLCVSNSTFYRQRGLCEGDWVYEKYGKTTFYRKSSLFLKS